MELFLKHKHKIDVCKETGCWQWQGEINRNGYGRAYHKGRRPVVHRLLYEDLVGPIPEGLVLDHVCKVRNCCNPMHMDPVTQKENVHRGDAVLFKKVQKEI